ncbi:MAG: phosphatidate cytidylyltransferase [Halofilum sp. (in: g-proteobacteria)]|nr:phosphatidate cytidylyltransferase [Halofilum sp. (in: g-proteobacteria)]
MALVLGALWPLAGATVAAIVLLAAVAWWCAVGLWLALGARPRAGTHGVRPGWLAVGLLLLPALALGITWLARGEGPGRWVLLYAICLVWVADIGADFAGRACGRQRLAPAVSAGKTWEGLAGGLAAVALYALAAAAALGVPPRLLGRVDRARAGRRGDFGARGPPRERGQARGPA